MSQTESLNIVKYIFVSQTDIANGFIKYNLITMDKCTACSGKTYCTVCKGTGFCTENTNYKITLPNKIKDGQKIRIEGGGKTDKNGNKGDLFLIVKLIKPQFKKGRKIDY